MSRKVFQATPLVQSIIAANGITSAQRQMSVDALDQVIFIKGSGGAVTIASTPSIEAHTAVGAILTLIGQDDTNTVTLPTGDTTLKINGPAVLGLYDAIDLMWCGDAYIELGRNF